MVNATGWNYLVNGSLIKAPLAMWDSHFYGYTILIFFVIYQIMLWRKTESFNMGFITGLFFAAAYTTSSYLQGTLSPIYSHSYALGIIYIIIVFELMAIIYGWFKK